MRKALLAVIALGVLMIATPAFAQDTMMGTFSAGLGGGFGDEDVGPFVLSGKYWDYEYELGAELFYSGDTEDEYEQLGMIWALYRYDLSAEEESTVYMGIGGGFLLDDDEAEIPEGAEVAPERSEFGNDWGIVAAVGWDAEVWGLEFKYGWFDPSLYSIVVYYHFE